MLAGSGCIACDFASITQLAATADQRPIATRSNYTVVVSIDTDGAKTREHPAALFFSPASLSVEI